MNKSEEVKIEEYWCDKAARYRYKLLKKTVYQPSIQVPARIKWQAEAHGGLKKAQRWAEHYGIEVPGEENP